MDEKLYETLTKQHKLPAYAALEREFDLLAIPKDSVYPMKEIAKKVFERLDLFRKTLETLTSPEMMLDMHESEALTEAEKSEIMELLRTLMRLDRMLLQAELDNGDEGYAAWITLASAQWMPLKPRIARILTKMEASWNGGVRAREQLNYLG